MPGGARELSNSQDFPRLSVLDGTEVVPGITTAGQPVGIPVAVIQEQADADITALQAQVDALETHVDDVEAIALAAQATAAAGVLPALEEFDAGQTAPLPANTYANGAAGVGATITGNANGALTSTPFDSVASAIAVGKRLWINLETGGRNGYYSVTQVGSAGTPFILTRVTDADTAAEINVSRFFVKVGGATHGGKQYQCRQRTADITMGVTNFTWSLISDQSGFAQQVSDAASGFASLDNRLDLNDTAVTTVTANAAAAKTAADLAAIKAAINKAYTKLNDVPTGFCILARERCDPVLVIKDARNVAGRFAGLLKDKITVSRGNNGGYYCNSDGKFVLASNTEMRLHYDFQTLEPLGILAEPTATNNLLHANDLTQAVWTKSNLTAAKDQIGPDGVPNSATRITATSANATATQGITAANARRTTSVFVRRAAGSGAFTLSQDGGVTELPATPVGNGWERFRLSGTLTNPSVVLKVATSGDAFDIWCVQCEVSVNDNATSPMPSAGTVWVRGVDVQSIAGATLTCWSLTEGTLFIESRSDAATNNSRNNWAAYHDANNSLLGFLYSGLTPAPGRAAFQVRSAGNLEANVQQASTFPVGVFYKQCYVWKLNQVNFAQEGTLGVLDTGAAMPQNTLANFFLGSTNAGAQSLDGSIGEIVYKAERITDDEAASISLRGFPAAYPIINIAPNDPRMGYSDYVTISLDSQRARFDRSPLGLTQLYDKCSTGARVRYDTRKKEFTAVVYYSNRMPAGTAYNGVIDVKVDGVFFKSFPGLGAATEGYYYMDMKFSTAKQRTIEFHMPYCAAVDWAGIAQPDAEIVKSPARPATVALLYADSIGQGLLASRPAATWFPQYCDLRGHQGRNNGMGSHRITAADGALCAAVPHDYLICVITRNDWADQTALGTIRSRYDGFLNGYRGVHATKKVVVVSPFGTTQPDNNYGSILFSQVRAEIDDMVADRIAAGDTHLQYILGTGIVPNSAPNFDTDGVHLNDTGGALAATNMNSQVVYP